MHNFDKFLLKQCQSLKQTSDQEVETEQKFSFYINAGLDLKLLHTKYTTTLFILAQVHSKLNNVDEGMKYCGLTLQRQLSNVNQNLKDWIVNATTLADAFLARDHFCQAEYLLYSAYHILPEDATKKKKLRAMVQMQLGRYYLKRLQVGVSLYINGLEFDQEKVTQRFVEFAELKLNWPIINSISSLDDAKTLFRLANTMFKKALEIYVLDGFVTEHVEIQQAICSLYKQLAKIETDLSRCELMH
jgi:tetratricopeptide (TPR) repeat protein